MALGIGESVRAMFANALLVRQEEGAEIDLQVGRTVTKAPRYMRTQLWLGVLQRYPGLGNKAAKQYFAYLRKPVPELVQDDISKDVGRTFPNIPRIQSPSGKASLFRVLKAYAALDPEVTYCQGMNFLAALLLIWMPSEAEAFGGLVVLMQERGLRDLYKKDMGVLQARLWQIGKLLPPSLAAHLEGNAVLPVLYASSWLLTAFSADFPLFWSSRIMDVILTDCYIEPMMKVVVGLMRTCMPALLRSNDMERMVRFIKTAPPRWPHATLQEVLTDSLAMEWTPAQSKVLLQTEGTESVIQAVERVQRLSQEDDPAAQSEPLADRKTNNAHIVAPATQPRSSGLSWASRIAAPVSLSCPPATPAASPFSEERCTAAANTAAGQGEADVTPQPGLSHLLDSPTTRHTDAAAVVSEEDGQGKSGRASNDLQRQGQASVGASLGLEQLSSTSSFGEFTGSTDLGGLLRRGSTSEKLLEDAPNSTARQASDAARAHPSQPLESLLEGEAVGSDSPAAETTRPRQETAGSAARPEASSSLLDFDHIDVSGLPEALSPSTAAAAVPAAATSPRTGRDSDRAATVERRLQQELSSLAIAVGREQDQR